MKQEYVKLLEPVYFAFELWRIYFFEYQLSSQLGTLNESKHNFLILKDMRGVMIFLLTDAEVGLKNFLWQRKIMWRSTYDSLLLTYVGYK